jgi:hypothetical protein
VKIIVEIKGMDSLFAEIEAKSEIVDAAYNIIVEELTDAVMIRGKEDVPVRTGNLRRNAYIYNQKTGDKFYVQGGFNTEYADIVDEAHPTRSGYFSNNVAIAKANIDRRISEL